MNKTLIIGITGSIASGKTEVVKLLTKKGYQVHSTDQLGHKALEIEEVKEKLADKLGREILSRDGQIDRNKLSQIVFRNKAHLQYLNSVTHPQIFKLMRILIDQATSDYIFFEVPLLFEAELENYFDFIITVSTRQENQLIRLMRRNQLKLEDAKIKLASQYSNQVKEKKADYVINNNNDLNQLKRKVDQLIKILPTIKMKHKKDFKGLND